jgi:hypothetical protein
MMQAMSGKEPLGPPPLEHGIHTTTAGADVVELVESRLSDHAWWERREDGWLDDNTPALSRGDAWILPLAWEPAAGDERWSEAFERLWTEVRGACEYRAGWQTKLILDRAGRGANGYLTSLVESGAEQAHWWLLQEQRDPSARTSAGGRRAEAAVVLVCARHREGARSLSLHVVPVEWLREKAGAKRAAVVPATDLSWSWADVARLYEASRRTGAKGEAEEGRD